jgi:hypothetical protein
MEGLHMLRKPEDVAKLRGLSVREVLGVGKGDGAAEETNGKAEAPAPVSEEATAEAPKAPEGPEETQ